MLDTERQAGVAKQENLDEIPQGAHVEEDLSQFISERLDEKEFVAADIAQALDLDDADLEEVRRTSKLNKKEWKSFLSSKVKESLVRMFVFKDLGVLLFFLGLLLFYDPNCSDIERYTRMVAGVVTVYAVSSGTLLLAGLAADYYEKNVAKNDLSSDGQD